MKYFPRFSLVSAGLFIALQLLGQTSAQNNILKGRVLYLNSGNTPAVGVQIKEKDSNGDWSKDNGEYRLIFQTKRNGSALDIEISPDTKDSKKIELVNEKEVNAAKLPSNTEEYLDIIVCPVGQRDIAAQKYYGILRTAADREIEKKEKEMETLLAQEENNYNKIRDLYTQINRMEQSFDSVKIHKRAFKIASINLDRASQLVKDAIQKFEEEQDVEGALNILNAKVLDTIYQDVSTRKKQAEDTKLEVEKYIQKADSAIRQVIEDYEVRIVFLEPQFKYSEIVECYEKLVEIYEKEEYDKEELAKYLNLTAINLVNNGEHIQALEYAKKAIDVQEEVLPTLHQDLAAAYNTIGVVYRYLGQYNKALEFTKKSLEIQKQILPFLHQDLATSHNDIGVIYGDLGENENALEYMKKALEILEQILPPLHPKIASSKNNIGFIYGILRNYEKAFSYEKDALEIRKQILPSNHPDLAQSYNNVGFIYGNLGDNKNALEYLEKALDLRKIVLHPLHPDLAQSFDNVGRIYNNSGEGLKGLEFQEKALEIRKIVLDSLHPDLGRSYYNVGGYYTGLGEYQKALEFNLKALGIYEKVLPMDHPSVALVYNNLSGIYGKLSEHDKRLKFMLKAVVIQEKVLPSDHPNLAIAYLNLSSAYREVGEPKRGIEFCQKAIHIGELSNPKPSYLNVFYTSLGITNLKADQFPEAKVAFEKSESLKEDNRLYQGWAMYYGLQNDSIKTHINLQKAVDLGFNDLKWIMSDESLNCIRDSLEYKAILEQLYKKK